MTSSLNLNDPPKSPITDSTWTPDEVNAGAAEYYPQSNQQAQYGYGAQDMSQMGMGGDQGQWGGYEQQGGQVRAKCNDTLDMSTIPPYSSLSLLVSSSSPPTPPLHPPPQTSHSPKS